jgi:hypothetical protein
MFGGGTRLENQQFSLREAYDTGRDLGKLFGGKVKRGRPKKSMTGKALIIAGKR